MTQRFLSEPIFIISSTMRASLLLSRVSGLMRYVHTIAARRLSIGFKSARTDCGSVKGGLFTRNGREWNHLPNFDKLKICLGGFSSIPKTSLQLFRSHLQHEGGWKKGLDDKLS